MKTSQISTFIATSLLCVSSFATDFYRPNNTIGTLPTAPTRDFTDRIQQMGAMFTLKVTNEGSSGWKFVFTNFGTRSAKEDNKIVEYTYTITGVSSDDAEMCRRPATLTNVPPGGSNSTNTDNITKHCGTKSQSYIVVDKYSGKTMFQGSLPRS
jgi:hypothetical protein